MQARRISLEFIGQKLEDQGRPWAVQVALEEHATAQPHDMHHAFLKRPAERDENTSALTGERTCIDDGCAVDACPGHRRRQMSRPFGPLVYGDKIDDRVRTQAVLPAGWRRTFSKENMSAVAEK
ncbi:hypothetical protein ANO11243_075720 [Dothideomycetidae sp. 11243]|nr:hypothetical protein ANO11243_075720 [fungal sp. No.11243]